MIKFTKQSNGLREYVKYMQYVDNDPRSKNYFRLYDFPDRLYVGKNAFRLSGNGDYLVKQSQIYIDIYDKNGNVIYHEILDVSSKDRTKTVVVYVYPDTPPGDAVVYIAGRLGTDPRTGAAIPYSNDSSDPNYKNNPNMYWVGRPIVITNKQNNTEIFFTEEPVITYSERQATYSSFATGSSRYTTALASSNNISLKSVLTPYQFAGDTSKFTDSYVDSSNTSRKIPTISNNTGVSNPSSKLPEYNGLSVLTTAQPFFSESMVGGNIIVRGISVSQFIPGDASSSTPFSSIPAYSASIVRVLNEKSVEVDMPFYQPITYTDRAGASKDIVFTQFINASNFTASFYNQNVNINSSSAVESFVTLNFKDIEPSAGTVDSIRVSYKDVGAFGDFIDVGKFPVTSQNLLTDSSNLKLTTDRGLVEVEVGKPRSLTEATTYWTASSVGVSGLSVAYSNSNILSGVSIRHSGSSDESQYVVMTVKDAYKVQAVEGTEYKLSLESYAVSGSTWGYPSMDVYISGSSIVTDRIQRSDRATPIRSYTLGTYIGTIDSRMATKQVNDFFFITKESKYIKPLFVVRSGIWEVGQVELKTRKEIGFSPNQVKLNIPITEFKRSSELILGVEYYNSDGIKANVDTKMYGVYFSGSTPVTYNNLPDKLDFKNAGSGRVLTSTGNPSASYAANSILYRTSSVAMNTSQSVDQLLLTNGAQVVMYATSSMTTATRIYQGVTQEYISEATFSFGTGAGNVFTYVPFTKMSTGDGYNPPNEYAGMTFTAETTIFGVSGSTTNPTQSSSTTHIWTSVVQGRMMIAGTGASPATVFNGYIVSGGMSTYGSFGSSATNNLDSRYTVAIAATTNGVAIRHIMADISSSQWFGFVTTRARVNKYERLMVLA